MIGSSGHLPLTQVSDAMTRCTDEPMNRFSMAESQQSEHRLSGEGDLPIFNQSARQSVTSRRVPTLVQEPGRRSRSLSTSKGKRSA